MTVAENEIKYRNAGKQLLKVYQKGDNINRSFNTAAAYDGAKQNWRKRTLCHVRTQGNRVTHPGESPHKTLPLPDVQLHPRPLRSSPDLKQKVSPDTHMPWANPCVKCGREVSVLATVWGPSMLGHSTHGRFSASATWVIVNFLFPLVNSWFWNLFLEGR